MSRATKAAIWGFVAGGVVIAAIVYFGFWPEGIPSPTDRGSFAGLIRDYGIVPLEEPLADLQPGTVLREAEDGYHVREFKKDCHKKLKEN